MKFQDGVHEKAAPAEVTYLNFTSKETSATREVQKEVLVAKDIPRTQLERRIPHFGERNDAI